MGQPLGRPQREPLRSLTAAERSALDALTRAGSERADRVARAKALLAVADGASFTAAAQQAGRRSHVAVGRLVARFNGEGIPAVEPGHGGGPPRAYGPTEAERILREVRRAPDREQEGTATWSLSTLQRALRRAPDGLPRVSTWTIGQALHDAEYTWQKSRTWCHTGTVLRKRKAGVVTVTDPETAEKKGPSSGRTARVRRAASRSGVRMRPARTRPFPSRVPPGSPSGSRRSTRTNTSVAAPRNC